jgi:uncharacterized membrane protein YeiH
MFPTSDILYFIDLVGTGVFAISGALTAVEKRMDVFGVSAVAFITAVGGGTLRDVLIGSTPVNWMKDLNYLLLIVTGIIIALIFKNLVQKLRRTFFLFDTIGIAVFTVLGIEKSLALDLHPIICMMMGMVSAVFGGVLRDIVCNEIPLIFRKEIYALTCLIGGAFFLLMTWLGLGQNLIILITILIIAVSRALAVRYNWQLPIKA